MTPSPTSDSTNIVLIVAVVLVVTAVIIVVVSIVMWKCKVVPKTKTHDYYNNKYLGNTNDIDEILFREQSFMSISAPMATNIHYDKKQPLWTFVFTSSICDILCISLFTWFIYYFKILAICKIFFFCSSKFFHSWLLLLGLTKSYLFFLLSMIFLGTICFKELYTCTVEYFPFFQVYFNCDNLHSFTVMDIFIFCSRHTIPPLFKDFDVYFFFYVYTL